MIELPKKKYNIIYADPAWSYNGKLPQRAKVQHYPVMLIEDICSIPVKDISADDSILFMWATFPLLQEGLNVVKSWGFTLKTCAFVWVKTNKRTDPKQAAFFPVDSFDKFWGMGGWTRSNAEICLLGTKGKPKRLDKGIHQVLYEPIREHSRKPDCVREKIVKLCGDLPRLEMFSRTQTPGWDIWGNQSDKFKPTMPDQPKNLIL